MDALSSSIDFRPRGRTLTMGGVSWLPRITDKARAKLRGTIGDYIYPCPADKKFLEKLGISEEEFTEIIASCPTDEDVIGRIRPIYAKAQKNG